MIVTSRKASVTGHCEESYYLNSTSLHIFYNNLFEEFIGKDFNNSLYNKLAKFKFYWLFRILVCPVNSGSHNYINNIVLKQQFYNFLRRRIVKVCVTVIIFQNLLHFAQSSKFLQKPFQILPCWRWAEAHWLLLAVLNFNFNI